MTHLPNFRPRSARLFGVVILVWVLCLALSACKLLPTRNDCPSAQDMTPDMLHGHWLAQIDGETPWTMTLGPHPEHQGSLRGRVTQGDQHHAVVADLDEGEFTLEESHDGQRIAATWLGQLTPSGCGRQIEGQRSPAGQKGRAFKLQRLP